MASGKKNYFRHSFFARNDIKLRLLKDTVGIGFYFYYFSLLELCGEQSSDQIQEKYVFHDSIIRSLWGVNLKKSERVAYQMHSVGLLFFEKQPKMFLFELPNFAKYLGKYTNKIETNTPNKRKGKKRKEKKSEKEKLTFDFESVYQTYPNKKGNKQKAIKSFKKIILTLEDYVKFTKAVENYVLHCKVKNKTDFIPHFVNFIEGYLDYWSKPEENETRAIPKEYENPFTSKEKNEK